MNAPVALGPIELSSPWILAPMAGVSEWPFRLLACEHGAAAAPTELISAKALIEGTARSERYIRRHPSESPFWVQLFGGDDQVLERGASVAVKRGANLLDLNMGCPVRKVTKSGAGSALLSNPDRAAAMVRALVRGGKVPVSVKIRAGWDEESLTYRELAHACAEAGAVAIAMHARTRVQAYSGSARWDWLADLVSHSPIPVIGNGDAFTAANAHRMLAETGCAAVMIGRGALGNPWVFEALRDGESEVTPERRLAVVERHFRDNLEHIGVELEAVRRFRKHLVWYANGLVGAESFLPQALRTDDAAGVWEQIRSFFGQARRLESAEIVFDERQALG